MSEPSSKTHQFLAWLRPDLEPSGPGDILHSFEGFVLLSVHVQTVDLDPRDSQLTDGESAEEHDAVLEMWKTMAIG